MLYTSESSTVYIIFSDSITCSSTVGAAADTAAGLAIVQTVDIWHFFVHFLWQLMLQFLHCAASLSQIFLPQ